ncbi:LacI family DNA-binding transcriptional regulator [Azospirillum doebereinerae]
MTSAPTQPASGQTPGLSPVNIQDVARAAGVSPASISNYLNGRQDRMRADTRARIQQAIETLGYKPNAAARQLKTGHSPMVGLLVPTVANPFFGELAVAVERAAQEADLHVILCNTLRDPAREHQFAEELAAYGVRGLITASTLVDNETMAGLAQRGIVRVSFDALSDSDSVTLDNPAAAAMAVAHLAGLGHRRIAYATGPTGTFNRAARFDGFKAEAERLALTETTVLVEDTSRSDSVFGDTDLPELGRRLARRIAAATPRPTAVLAVNDMTALGILAELRVLGLRVPEDVSVVGIDDIGLATLLHPALTTIRQPLARMAETAIGRLALRLAGDTGPGTRTVFPPELVVRASSGPPPIP